MRRDPFTAAVRHRLLVWYDEHRRDLPWRDDLGPSRPDPYRVWVSEAMLQQTRVRTVIPYFERWMERFPTLDALARADREDVLRAWAGLGYYARARSLHRAARIVRDQYGGALPDTAPALRELPGVGDYTAGAIASIAFGRREPAVDANARRVLARLLDLPSPTDGEIRGRAAALVPARRPGAFNQALMDLGATLCAPRAPACPACPLGRLCRSHARGTQDRRPGGRTKGGTSARRPVPRFRIGTAVIVAADGRVLLARRPERGLLAGMWEFPGAVTAGRESPLAAAGRAFSAVADHFGDIRTTSRGASRRSLVRVRHAYTHRFHEYHAYRFDVVEGAPAGQVAGDRPWTEFAWARPCELGGFPLSAAQWRIAQSAAVALGGLRTATPGRPARRPPSGPAAGLRRVR